MLFLTLGPFTALGSILNLLRYFHAFAQLFWLVRAGHERLLCYFLDSVAVHGVAATAALVVPSDAKEVILVSLIVFGSVSHATLPLIANVNHAAVDENFAVYLTNCLFDHALVTELELFFLVVIVKHQLTKHLCHFYLLGEKAMHLVLFLFNPLSYFVLCNWERVIK